MRRPHGIERCLRRPVGDPPAHVPSSGEIRGSNPAATGTGREVDIGTGHLCGRHPRLTGGLLRRSPRGTLAQTSVRHAPHSDQVTAAPSHQSSEASDCSKAGRGRFAPLRGGTSAPTERTSRPNVHDARCIVDRHGRMAHHVTLCVSTMLGSQPVGSPLSPLLVGNPVDVDLVCHEVRRVGSSPGSGGISM